MSTIEVFWSQARILTEFFAGTAASSTTSAAIHFTERYVECEFPKADALWKMRNDQIAHMNYARTTQMSQKLQKHDMYLTAEAIKRAMTSFEQNLKRDARTVWDNRTTGRIEIQPNIIYVPRGPSGPTNKTTTSPSSGWGWGPTLPAGPPR